MKAYEYIIKIKSQTAQRSLEKLQIASGQAHRGIDRVKNGLERAAGAGNRFKFSLNGVSGALAGLGLGISAVALAGFGKDSLRVAADAESLKNALIATSGSAEGARQNLAFLDNLANRLGLNLQASQEGFKSLSGAMMGSKLAGAGTREIFEGVAYGAAAMGLSADSTKGAFLALGQMMSKGRVQAEELRGQLSERIPGAFKHAATAMGVTEVALNKMLERGEVMAEDFLPKFAAQLKKTFQTDAEKAAESMRAKMNRMSTAMYKFQIAAGNALAPLAEQFFTLATKAMHYVTPMLEGLKSMVSWLKAHKELAYGVAAAVGVAAASFGAFVLVTKGAALALGIYNGVMAIARVSTIVMAGKMGLLNAVMTANPIGLVVTAIGALVGTMVWAYNKFDWFRGGVWGLWEAFKEVFMSIADIAKKVFGGLWDMVTGLIDGISGKGWDRLKKGALNLGEGLLSANPVGLGLAYGEKIAKAAAKGYNNGLSDFNRVVKQDSGEGYWRAASSIIDQSGPGQSTSDPTKEGVGSITGGGKKMVNVTVNVSKLNENINVTTNNLQEGVGEIEDKFLDMMTRVLGSANYAASQ